MVTTKMESKLGQGKPLSGEELLHYLPPLSEVPKGVFTKFAQDAAVLRHFKAGEIICHEGDFGSTAFYLVSGRVDIYIANPLAHVTTAPTGEGFLGRTVARMKSLLSTGTPQADDTGQRRNYIPVDASVDLDVTAPIAQLGPGELFGEMTCRNFQPRSATVRAVEDCVMVEVLRVILDMLLGTRDIRDDIKATTKVKAATFKGTSFKAELDRKYRERSLVNYLKRVPVFKSLDETFIRQLCQNVELKTFYKDEVICREKDMGDSFYLIRQGLIRVSQEKPGGEMVLTYLSRGDYFGEIALLQDSQRTATCTAVDTVDVVVIRAEDFHAMSESFPEVREALKSVAEKRILSSKSRQLPSLPVNSTLDEALNLGLLQAQNLLIIDLDKCTRCDLCVQACAEAHEGVSRLLRDGTRFDNYLVATACRSCQDPLCMTQCPVGSIRRKENLEIVIEDWCIGCTKCAELCPYGNITMHPVEIPPAAKPAPADGAAGAPAAQKPVTANKATTCDLCTQLSTPSCVYACPHDAAMRVNPADFFSRKMPGLKDILANPRSYTKGGFRTTH